MKVKVGADPEFFLFDSKTKKHVSAHGIVPGDKANPHKLNYGAVQLDGTAVEFNIEPASTAFEFKHNIEATLGQIRKMVPSDLEFSFEPAVFYEKDYFDKVPDKHKEFGCDPDYNALSRNPAKPKVPPAGVNPLMRTGAGHIHLGWTEVEDPLNPIHFWDATEVTKQMYYVFYQAETVWEKPNERKKLYGGGASFRPKRYGCEFRSPSNAWVKYPNLYNFIFETSQAVVNKLEKGMNVGINFQHVYQYQANKRDQYNSIADRSKMPTIPENWDQL